MSALAVRRGKTPKIPPLCVFFSSPGWVCPTARGLPLLPRRVPFNDLAVAMLRPALVAFVGLIEALDMWYRTTW